MSSKLAAPQMVLNSQYAREIEASRRDIALHAKLDELIKTDAAARNALIGLEKRSQDEIEELRIDEEQSALP